MEVGCKRKYLTSNSLNQSLLEQASVMNRNSEKMKLLINLFEQNSLSTAQWQKPLGTDMAFAEWKFEVFIATHTPICIHLNNLGRV